MKRLALCLLAMAVPCTVLAGEFTTSDEVNLNVHVQPADFSQGTACDAFGGEGAECSTALSHDPVAGQAFLYVIASNVNGWNDMGTGGNPDATGLGALQFGIEYTGLNILSWFLCTGDLQIPQDDGDGTWPESGTGNAMTWPAGCYDPGGENASVGLFLVDDATAGSLQITADPRQGGTMTAAYVDCTALTFIIPEGGQHNLNLDGSSAPFCDVIVPTEERSWGQIKALF